MKRTGKVLCVAMLSVLAFAHFCKAQDAQLPAAIWPPKALLVPDGRYPDFEPVAVPQDWDRDRLEQALYKHLQALAQTKLSGSTTQFKEGTTTILFRTRPYEVPEPMTESHVQKRSAPPAIIPQRDGLILSVRFEQAVDQFARPQFTDRGQWAVLLACVYLPDVKLYLNVDVDYGPETDRAMLAELCAPTRWLKTIFADAPGRIDLLIRESLKVTKNSRSERQAYMRLVSLGDAAVPALLDKLASAARYPPGVRGPDDAGTLIEMLSEIGTEKALPFVDEEERRMMSELSLSQLPVDSPQYQSKIWTAHCKERITIWNSPDRFDQLVRSLEKPYLRKWAIYKLGVLCDKKAIPHLEKIRRESNELDLRESAGDSIKHIESKGKEPLQYQYHLAEERLEITTAKDTYTLQEPVPVQYELISGEYGSRTLVRFAKAAGHLLPFGPAGPKGCNRYKLQVTRKGTNAELLSEPINIVPLEEFTLAPGLRVKGEIDLAKAYRLQPGEYQVCVCIGDRFVFSNIIKIQVSR